MMPTIAEMMALARIIESCQYDFTHDFDCSFSDNAQLLVQHRHALDACAKSSAVHRALEQLDELKRCILPDTPNAVSKAIRQAILEAEKESARAVVHDLEHPPLRDEGKRMTARELQEQYLYAPPHSAARETTTSDTAPMLVSNGGGLAG